MNLWNLVGRGLGNVDLFLPTDWYFEMGSAYFIVWIDNVHVNMLNQKQIDLAV